MVTITKRGILILEIICKASGPVTACQLAELAQVSERTVRYDLDLLTDWLGENDIRLLKVPKKGIFLQKADRDRALLLLEDKDAGDDPGSRYLNSNERVCMIIIDVLEKKSNYSFDEASEGLDISRATYLRYLEKVADWFGSHGVELLRRQRKGIRIDADETVYRRLIIDFIMENSSQTVLTRYFMAHNGEGGQMLQKPSTFSYINRIINSADLGHVIGETRTYLKNHGIVMNDDKFIHFIYYLAVMMTRVKEGHIIEGLPDQYWRVTEGAERRALKNWLIDRLPGLLTEEQAEQEAAYLTVYAHAVTKSRTDIAVPSNSETAQQISAYLLEETGRRLGFGLMEDGELAKALKTHLQAAIMRGQLGIPVHNEMLEEIKKRFPEIFRECTAIAEKIDECFKVCLGEEEIGYITMYIALDIQQKKAVSPELKKLRVALICGYGVGAVAFLTDSLKRQFPQVIIADKLSVFDVHEYGFSEIDMVLTTIDMPLPISRPVIKVSPMLSKRDVRKIESFLRTCKSGMNNISQDFKVNELMGVIGRYCDIRDGDGLMEALREYMGAHGTGLLKLTELPSLRDIISKKHIMAGTEAADWEEAVRKTAEPLIRDGYATEAYLNEIIEIKERYNQYSLISGGLCMAHAAPDPGCRLACSLSTLKKPVEIELDGEAVKIYVVMVLSLSDTMTQAKALDEMFNLLDEFPDLPTEMQKASNSAELGRIFKNFYEKLF